MSETAAAVVATPEPSGPSKPGSKVGAPQGNQLTDFFLDGINFSEAPASIGESEAVNAQQASVQAATEGAEEPQEEATGPLEGDEPEEVEAKPILPPDKGTKDKPFSIKDMPEDAFVEVKIDGKKEIVSLRDAARGYIQQETFSRGYQAAKDAMGEAKHLAETAKAQQEAFRDRINQLLDTPADFYKFMRKHAPQTMEGMAKMLASDMVRWQKEPGSYERELLAEREAEFAEREQRAEQSRREQAEQQRLAQQTQEAQRALAPGFAAGLKKIGVLDPSKLTPEFRATVKIVLQGIQDGQRRPLKAEDMVQAMVRANELHPVTPVAARRPAAAPAPTRAPNGQRSRKDYAGVPKNIARNDPDWWLSGTKFE